MHNEILLITFAEKARCSGLNEEVYTEEINAGGPETRQGPFQLEKGAARRHQKDSKDSSGFPRSHTQGRGANRHCHYQRGRYQN